MRTMRNSYLLIAFLFTAQYLKAFDWVGKYYTDGSHPWHVEVTIDHRFKVTFSDSGGFHLIEGIWKEYEGKLFLLEKKSKNYEVFRIISFENPGEFTIESEDYAVIDTIGNMPSCRCPNERIVLLKPRFKLIKQDSNKQPR